MVNIPPVSSPCTEGDASSGNSTVRSNACTWYRCRPRRDSEPSAGRKRAAVIVIYDGPQSVRRVIGKEIHSAKVGPHSLCLVSLPLCSAQCRLITSAGLCEVYYDIVALFLCSLRHICHVIASAIFVTSLIHCLTFTHLHCDEAVKSNV